MPSSGPEFAWDRHKELVNIEKHSIDFTEAKSVFFDEFARLMDDPDHSDAEDRFLIIGMSHKFKCLIVCHCYRQEEDVIRIISARKATRREKSFYKES